MPDPAQIPLALYVHIPWCLRKCPYCDFNSHERGKPRDEMDYINHLLADFTTDYDGRPLQSIFIGGGTPSLFSGASIAALLEGLVARATFAADIEITLEANPGSFEREKFRAYRAAGINRLSLGIQSFSSAQLRSLGRIHDADEACRAIVAAEEAGFSRVNIDLMFALPGQTVADALDDLEQALAFQVEHISWYQLTLEPNTPFYTHPPKLPDDEAQDAIYLAGCERLAANALRQYETSAWTLGEPSAHNLNYWQFGDYIGIGAGAHGKRTDRSGKLLRTSKYRSPSVYQKARGRKQNPYQEAEHLIDKADQAFEFMMNALRLKKGVTRNLLQERTELRAADIHSLWTPLVRKGLVEEDPLRYCTSARGFALLNDVLEAFLPEFDAVARRASYR